MATGEWLLNRATRKIDEPDFDGDDILDLLNEGLLMVAQRLLFPGLQASATITTSTTDTAVPLPANYHKGLYAARLVGGNGLRVISSFGLLMNYAGHEFGRAGNIAMVCEHGSNLAYDRIPDPGVAIKLFYYRKPALITEETPVLDGITPSVLERVERAIIHYAAGSAADDQESGIQKLDTNHHLRLFEDIVEEIRVAIGGNVSLPPPPVVTGCFR